VVALPARISVTSMTILLRQPALNLLG